MRRPVNLNALSARLKSAPVDHSLNQFEDGDNDHFQGCAAHHEPAWPHCIIIATSALKTDGPSERRSTAFIRSTPAAYCSSVSSAICEQPFLCNSASSSTAAPSRVCIKRQATRHSTRSNLARSIASIICPEEG